MNRKVAENQERARTLLKALGLDYFELEGSDPQNKLRRNQLFELSGRPIKYPQFFLLEEVLETQFIGDADELEVLNDASSLPESILEQNPQTLTWERLFANSGDDAQLVFLLSSTPLNLKTLHRQQRAEMVLRGRQIPFIQIDGADPDQRVDRNALFEISGMRANYPQFFCTKTVVRTSYLGDSEDVETINEATSLPPHILHANPSIITWDKVLAA